MKIAFLTISMFLLCICLFAATPPVAVQKTFDQMFAKSITIKWAKENSKEWEAEFLQEGIKVSANFLNDGTWVETEREIEISQLPSLVSASILKNNPDYKIANAYKIESNSKPLKYEADIKCGNRKKEVVVLQDGSLTK